MKYYDETVCKPDQLAGGSEFPTAVYNVACLSSATLERGDLICAASMSGNFNVVTSASDASKVLAICAAGNEGTTTAAAYFGGKFNREQITFGGNSTLTTEPFGQALRTQGIWITGQV